jgi:hypothetical protein
MNRQIGTTVELSLLILTSGVCVTGASPTVGVRRTSDGYWWDWNDSTFKNAGWTTRLNSMTEVGANAPGFYVRNFTPGAQIVAPGTYGVHFIWIDGSDAYESVDVEHWVLSDIADKTLVNKMTVDGATSTLKVYEQDGVTVAKTWDVKDKDGSAVVLTGTGPARRGVPT